MWLAAVEFVDGGGRLLAIVVRGGFDEEGTYPLTDESLPLQMSVLVKEEGEGSPAHVHAPSVAVDQGGRYRHEMLHVLDGRVDVGVHTGEGVLAERVVLGPGDTILLFEGHDTVFLERTRLVEIKEGPYPGPELDKRWL
jgi:hypothetical protein